MKHFVLFLLMALISACDFSAPPPQPMPQQPLYFPETGHSIRPPFATFYLQSGQRDLLGYPITEALTDSGWTVQYFQFGRLEIHPENPQDYFITIGWLGQLCQRSRPPILQNYSTSGHYFAETGHTVSGVYLDFFNANGGSVQFGKPISEPFVSEGKIVQDFQSARMVWSAKDDAVFLEPLGENYLLQSGDDAALSPIPMPESAVLGDAPATNVLPADALVTTKTEDTPSPDFVRVVISLANGRGQPIAGYSPRLRIGDASLTFPPSLANGRTHLLIPQRAITQSTAKITDYSGTKILAPVEFTIR